MRLAIAENMVRAVSEAPHVTALFEADFSAVAAHKSALAARGVKLSYTAYIVKAAAEAMAVAPAINGRWEADRIAISPTIDIGVGTALGEKGLVVPVVKDAGSLSLQPSGAMLDDLGRRRDRSPRPGPGALVGDRRARRRCRRPSAPAGDESEHARRARAVAQPSRAGPPGG